MLARMPGLPVGWASTGLRHATGRSPGEVISAALLACMRYTKDGD
jgi:hypothetical protein